MTDKKVLIVDDDPGILDSVKLMLEFEGYNVFTLSKGSEIFKIKEYPHLILLDVWLSGENGKDICRQLKAQRETRNIPVIMVSASRELELSAHEAGADCFIAKPFEMNELLGKIEGYFKP